MLRLKRLLVLLLLMVAFVLDAVPVKAQCSVCRTSVENSDREGGGNIARGINNGILYLMVIPYAFAGITALIILKMRKRNKLKETQS